MNYVLGFEYISGKLTRRAFSSPLSRNLVHYKYHEGDDYWFNSNLTTKQQIDNYLRNPKRKQNAK